MLAGLDWAAGQGAEAIVTAAADTPFFPRDLVAASPPPPSRRRHAARDGDDARREAGPDRHPTFGLWPVALRDDLRAALAAGLRKVVAWTEPHGCAAAALPRPATPSSTSTPRSDLARAQAMLEAARR